jgi:hypothetical protein
MAWQYREQIYLLTGMQNLSKMKNRPMILIGGWLVMYVPLDKNVLMMVQNEKSYRNWLLIFTTWCLSIVLDEWFLDLT